MKHVKPVESFNIEDPLAPVDGEPIRANRALRDYALMGSRRSIKALLDRYVIMEDEWSKNKTRIDRPPTVRWMTLSNYSVKYRWVERAKANDEILRLAEQAKFQDDRLKWRQHRLD